MSDRLVEVPREQTPLYTARDIANQLFAVDEDAIVTMKEPEMACEAKQRRHARFPAHRFSPNDRHSIPHRTCRQSVGHLPSAAGSRNIKLTG